MKHITEAVSLKCHKLHSIFHNAKQSPFLFWEAEGERGRETKELPKHDYFKLQSLGFSIFKANGTINQLRMLILRSQTFPPFIVRAWKKLGYWFFAEQFSRMEHNVSWDYIKTNDFTFIFRCQRCIQLPCWPFNCQCEPTINLDLHDDNGEGAFHYRPTKKKGQIN